MPNIFDAEVNDSTLDDVIGESANRRRRMLSRATMAVIAAIVLAGLLGFFEQRRTISTGSPAANLEVEYPNVVRAGHEVDLVVTVSSAQPLPDTLQLSLSEDYVQLFEDFSVQPEPESQSAGAQGTIVFEVAPQPGTSTAVIHFTGRASDEWSPRTSGLLELELEDTWLFAELDTWRIP